MRIIIYNTVLLLAFVRFAVASSPAYPWFLPNPPPVGKSLAQYSAGDVLSCICADKLPAGHQFAEARLKTEWPGANDDQQIDILVQIALTGVPSREVSDVLNNILWILRNVMNVSNDAKASALLRAAAAQTDPARKLQAERFAISLFPDCLDPRLLGLAQQHLTNSTEILVIRGEDGGRRVHSARSMANANLHRFLKEVLHFALDRSQFFDQDEAVEYDRLSGWITSHWTEITDRCLTERAKPNRKLRSVYLRTWEIVQSPP